MFALLDDLQLGGITDCQRSGPGLVVVHACKYPCHAEAVGYTGSLPKEHRYYLAMEHSGDLYLNLIDPPKPLFQVESFTRFLDFAHRHWARGNKLLLHCNQGQSRAPALALLLLARVGEVRDVDYAAAAADMLDRYSDYKPGVGIQLFLRQYWSELMAYVEQ